ncbi:MAG: hypothetical protein ABR567_20500 [Myxococcales bacterium]|nr:hypothetical protein [Myxococcales bacterium]
MLSLFLLLASTVRGPADVESLTAVSDAVVHASVVRTSSDWGKGGGQIFTAVVLRTIETWKGDPRRAITVVVPGGSIGELSQTVSGVAEFRAGEEVVVFLRERSIAVYSVERLALGKFAVGPPSGLPKRAIRDRKGLQCVGCAASESDDLPLDELRARVLRSARK